MTTMNFVTLKTESKTGGRASLSIPMLYQSLYGMYETMNTFRRSRMTRSNG